MSTAAKVGVILDKLRDEANVSVKSLAEQTMIARQTLQRRLKGDPGITFDEVERIASALGTTTESVWALAREVA